MIMNTKNGNNMVCTYCGKTYKVRKWLENHIKTKHAADAAPLNTTGNALISTAEGAITSTSVTAVSNVNDREVVDDVNIEDDEDNVAAQIAAAKGLDWDNWSGTDDEEEVESYVELVLDPWREEEEEEKRREALAGTATVEPAPSKKTPKEVLVTCKDCGATFTTFDGFVKHRVGHGMHAAVLRLPELGEIVKHCPQLCSGALDDLEEMKLTQGCGPTTASAAKELKQCCESEVMKPILVMLCEKLLSFLQEKKDFLYPSAFASAFLVHSSVVVLDEELRHQLSGCVSNLVNLSEVKENPVACNVFLTNFIMKFASKLLAHILRLMRVGVDSVYVPLEERYALTYQSVLSLDFKQNMHYIGGSNVKSILKTALRVKHKNAEWHRVMDTIKNNFLISEFSKAPESELMAWTDTLDRGRLTRISEKALEFFVQLGSEVKPLERLDGSLMIDEVIEKISKSAALLLRWDELKGSLSEKESFKLLHAITSQFCVTWRNGIIGRRHDEMARLKQSHKFGTGGVAFRATLGGK